MSETLMLFPYGDTELFTASGENWSLPLFVEWRHDRANDRHYAYITPPLAFYQSQLLAINALLQVHDIMGRKDRWLVYRPMAETLLHKAAGITPQAYYKWPDPSMPPIKLPSVLKVDKISGITNTKSIEETSDLSFQDPFIAYVANESGINRSVVKAVFKAVCDYAPFWMLEKRKEINFGFFRLFAAPFRPNWKEIVAFKFKKWKLLELFAAPGDKRYDLLDDAGLPSALCSLHNIALKKHNKNSRISYTLEAVPNHRFEKVVDDVERKRLISGGNSYVASFEKTVSTLYDALISSLENYLHKTSLPFARLHEGSKDGQLRLLPTTANKIKVRGVGIRHIPVDVISPDSNFYLSDGIGNDQTVPPPSKKVRKVPALPSSTEDVREPEQRPDLVEQGPEGATRMSMLDADKMLDTGRAVLPGLEIGTGDSSGVD